MRIWSSLAIMGMLFVAGCVSLFGRISALSVSLAGKDSTKDSGTLLLDNFGAVPVANLELHSSCGCIQIESPPRELSAFQSVELRMISPAEGRPVEVTISYSRFGWNRVEKVIVHCPSGVQ